MFFFEERRDEKASKRGSRVCHIGFIGGGCGIGHNSCGCYIRVRWVSGMEFIKEFVLLSLIVVAITVTMICTYVAAYAIGGWMGVIVATVGYAATGHRIIQGHW